MTPDEPEIEEPRARRARAPQVFGDPSSPDEDEIDGVLRPDFMESRTAFASLGEMIEVAGLEFDDVRDLIELADDDWEAFVREHSDFDSWQEMIEAGNSDWDDTR
jgi:hypothetical protein